jgi:hypothetical protein
VIAINEQKIDPVRRNPPHRFDGVAGVSLDDYRLGCTTGHEPTEIVVQDVLL